MQLLWPLLTEEAILVVGTHCAATSLQQMPCAISSDMLGVTTPELCVSLPVPTGQEGWARSEWQLVLPSSSKEGELNNYIVYILKNQRLLGLSEESGLAPRQTIQ